MSDTTTKRQSRAKLKMDTKLGTVTATLANATSPFATFNAALLPGTPPGFNFDTILGRCALLGLQETVRDSYSDKDSDVVEEATGRWETLTAGMWAEKGERGANLGDFFEAYAATYKKDLAETKKNISAILAGDDATKKAMVEKIRSALAPQIAEIRAKKMAERAKALKAATKGHEAIAGVF